MTVISLTTDFGNQNGFVGTMKGVIWGIAPDAQIADISHEIPPQDIRAAALTLRRAVPYFPASSVHIAVVDPGVGTARRPLGARLGNQFFILPDNGLITPLLEATESRGDAIELVHLNRPEYWLPQVYNTFHGRDVFAPCGAHLAAGVPLSQLGSAISDPLRSPLPRPLVTPTGFEAHILLFDVFGNATTDLPLSALPDPARVHLRLPGGEEIHGVLPSYGYALPGELVAVGDSEGYLELALVDGSAKNRYALHRDDLIRVSVAA